MRLEASEKQHRYHNLLDDDHANEMLESEGAGLAARVAELEVRCSRQAEELLCLRSTLADALRRLNALEGRAPTTASTQRNGAYSGGTTGTPTRELRIRQPTYRESVKRTSSYGSTASSLSQRRGPQHQSTGSLQSDSPASSSSLSPAPSPSPRATPAPSHHVQPYRSRNNSTSGNQSPGNNLTKRWSSTGDFNAQGLLPNTRFTTTKSLLNLYSKQPSQNGPILKHGTHTCQYNEEDGSMRMFIRGRPVVMYAPTDLDNFDPSKVAPPPQNKLKLEWVYGYRGKDCRSNLYLLPTGEIVYFVAAVVVLFNVEEQCQRHYTGHTDDVKCIAIHPNKLVIASGQCAGHDRLDARPHVRVWNSVSLATLAVLGAGHMERAVACVSFSRADGGALLACVDDGPDHTISVWDWQRSDRPCVAETKCSVDTVVAAEFHPLDRNQIVTCGKGHIAFWTLDASNVLYKRMGVFETRDKPKYVTCLGFNHNGDVISGDSNGNLIVWGRGTNTIVKLVRGVHDGAVFSLCARKDGGVLSAGGKDGRLVLFDAELSASGHENVIEGHYGGVRVVCEGRGSQLFVGTTRNCILHGDLQLGFVPAVLGHVDEVWGLATHPSLPQFVSAGWDRLLQLWDGLSHSTVWSKDIEERAQCCAWSSDGEAIAVGCAAGRWLVFSPTTRELRASMQDGTEAIQIMVYSPNNRLMAVGSRDNFIYLYEVDGDRYSRLGKCLGHSSFITHLDWSEDSQYIRSNSGDYELLFWNATTCRQVTSPTSMRDVTWATSHCPITFHTVGVWPEGADGTDINSCTRSPDNKLIATGDDFGKVKLYAYPVTQPKSLCASHGGHSSHVTCVRFLHEGRLLSAGGHDAALLQWHVD